MNPSLAEAHAVEINGKPVYWAKGSFVDEERLFRRSDREALLAQLRMLADNYDAPIYTQRAPLHMFRRVKWGETRIYLRFFPVHNVLAILAFRKDRELKRDESHGSLAYSLIDYLLSHQIYEPTRFRPLLELPVLEQTKTEEEIAPAFKPRFSLKSQGISQEEADGLLESTRRARLDPLFDHIIGEIYKRNGEERILLPAVWRGRELSQEEIKRVKLRLPKHLKGLNLNYKIRFDDFSGKFVLVRPEKLGMLYSPFHHREPKHYSWFSLV